ncbi:hypothetical protein RUM44_004570 [Polyplax serrata]|uniref:Tetratricopeptide repeat protein 21A/21B C-terminal ARM domain-containing protein n=1 Tax=Polyplax serrata TaxID=468196 RepID=A0ABR1B4Y1_POLSC
MGINPNSILFNVFGYLVIALLGATSSINSLNGDFVFDDTEVLVNNRDILPDTPLANVFRNDYWGTNLKSNHSHKSYRPLTILSFRWNYAAVGGLHPRGFHLVNIALHILISFLIWSVSLIILGKNKLFIGFLASVLFSVHPIHSEAVCGIVGRADLLCALFFILSLIIFSKSNCEGPKEWICISLSIFVAGISMLCKEQGVTAIGILSVYDMLFLNRITITNFRDITCKIFAKGKESYQIRKLLRRQCILVASGLCLTLLRYYLMDFQGPTFQRVDNPASFEKDWLTRDLTLGFSLLAIVFLLRSFERSSDWKDEAILFNSGALVCPLNAKVHYNIAKNAVDSGNVEKAINEYREAIRLLPDYDQALNNLANILKSRGNLEEAENLLRRALDVRQEFPAAWMNLGIVLTQGNRFGEAEKCYNNALKYRKNYPDCYYNLGNMYLAQNRHAEAEKAWRVAITLKPTFSIAWNNLILSKDNGGNLSMAISIANEALTHMPNDSGIHFNLANALGKAGEFQMSEKHFLEALKLNPTNPQYHTNLGVLYHRWKRYRNAMECYKKALKINPNFKSAKENYEALRKKMNQLE